MIKRTKQATRRVQAFELKVPFSTSEMLFATLRKTFGWEAWLGLSWGCWKCPINSTKTKNEWESFSDTEDDGQEWRSRRTQSVQKEALHRYSIRHYRDELHPLHFDLYKYSCDYHWGIRMIWRSGPKFCDFKQAGERGEETNAHKR